MDAYQMASLAAASLATGVFAGVTAGLLGVGGGIVIVPVLFYAFGLLGIDENVRMHLAVGTSLATIIPTSIVSAKAHRRRDAVDIPLLKSWAPAIFCGVLAGTAIAGTVRGAVLTAVFAAVAMLVAAHMAFRPEGAHVRETLPTGWAKLATGASIGAFSAMMGIGGGTLSVPILSACNYPIRRAVGTASAIGLIIAVPGTVGFRRLAGAGVDRPAAGIARLHQPDRLRAADAIDAAGGAVGRQAGAHGPSGSAAQGLRRLPAGNVAAHALRPVAIGRNDHDARALVSVATL